MKFIDIHTHHKNTDAAIFSVLNCYPNSVDFTVPFSVGIHPWFIHENSIEEELVLIEKQLKISQCVAIGECGLDKMTDTNFKIQEEVFIKQVALSEKYKKPMIIHCVKAFNELVALKKELKPTQVWILHGFQKKKQLANELVKNGMLLSFGKAVLQKESLQNVIADLPIDHFFLETDDADLDIKELYQKVASIKKLKTAALQKEIQQHFNTVFLS